MQIPGHIDPLTVPRPGLVDGVTPRADGRVDLIGLPRPRIAALFAEAGLDAKAAKLRAKQVWHWLYHRGVTDFEAMTDIAKTMRPWLAERFHIGRPEVVEAQHSVDGTRKWLLRTAPEWRRPRLRDGLHPRRRRAARCASPARSAARSIAGSATPARCGWCAT